MELDLKYITENNISPNGYVYLYIVYKEAYPLLSKVHLSKNIDDRLFTAGWLEKKDKVYVVTQKYIDTFVTDIDRMFKELIEIYPNRVKKSNGGTRVLCTKDPEAQSNLKAKKRYERIIAGKPHLHVHILSCLHKQLSSEKNNLEYMQNLETWLNNYTWERYADIDENDNEETRITRKL